jgi:glycine/D-amino acid oxidase-like deaminating enzyme
MRTAVVGAGLAGTLLAWRLARMPGNEVTLIGRPASTDATAASGGLVRGFEVDAHASRLATGSLLELRGSRTLREWSGYRESGSLYVCDAAAAGAAAAVERALPGSVRVLSQADLQRGYGLGGLPDDAVGLAERRAGWYSPDRLRTSIGCELAGLGVTRVAAPVTSVGPGVCRAGQMVHRFDRVVLATGRWTGTLLRRSGLPADGYRTKLIQYSVARMAGPPLPALVDDTSGLYGRSTPDGSALLGLPSRRWDIPPDAPVAVPALAARLVEIAAVRLPGRTLGPATVTAGADCYCEPPGLQLRPVADVPDLFTFTGGSGGAAKTALAASTVAARQLSTVLTGGRL